MKKNFALRIDSEVYDAIEKWAADEFRSVNGQIEWILNEALKKAKRMPKKKIVTVLLLCVGLTAHAQWYTGMSQKTGLALCIHLTDSAPELYSPMQTTDPIPVSSWSLQDDTLRIDSKSIGFKTVLTRRDNIMTGYWKQGIMKENITFYPSDTLFLLRRPQTPQPPYSFDEETVTADLIDWHYNKVHIEGTLTYPKGSGRYPCLVLVSGSGQQDRNEEIMQHKPFLVLADYLASRGIAVLRYDDRGVGASTGEVRDATTECFADDAEAMFNAIKNNPHIDPDRLGIGGHSEGGAIAPMVAARNKDVKFVVMLAGQGSKGHEILEQQGAAILRAAGVSERLIAIRQACMDDVWSAMYGTGKLLTQKEIQQILQSGTKELSKEELDSIGLGRGAAHTLKQQLDSPWLRAFYESDPWEYLPKVQCPVLALNGSKDMQVLAHPNLDRIKALCPQADCRELPDLNHLFQHCSTGTPDEYILIEETFSTEAMKAVADFILKQ